MALDCGTQGSVHHWAAREGRAVMLRKRQVGGYASRTCRKGGD